MATISFEGSQINTIGVLPKPGSIAPDFVVTKIDLSEIRLKNYLGKKIILNIFPSLDTKTCASAMIKFNKLASDNPNMLILCISADLPFAQKRFCTAEHLNNIQPASTFRHPEFGKNYGVTITEGPLKGLLARALVLLDEEGKVVYTQLVNELTHEPNYTQLTKELQKESVAALY